MVKNKLYADGPFVVPKDSVDILDATWRVGENIVIDLGYQTAFDHPAMLEVAAEYSDSPGLVLSPRNY